jgi:hypothetical protein
VPPATIAPPAAAPFSLEHQRELMLARDRVKPIQRAARVANFNAWASFVVAICSAPFAFFSLLGGVVFAALSLIAYNEFRGRKQLLNFEPAGATLLGWNQLGLLAMIIVYCIWMLYTNLTGANTISAELNSPQMKDLLGSLDLDTITRQIVIALYGSVIVLSILFQGGNAIYYFSRRKYVEAYANETPEWVRSLQGTANI